MRLHLHVVPFCSIKGRDNFSTKANLRVLSSKSKMGNSEPHVWCVWVCVCVSNQCVSAGVMQQPSFPQDSTRSPLSVMHCLDQSHQGDVGAETRADGGPEDRTIKQY